MLCRPLALLPLVLVSALEVGCRDANADPRSRGAAPGPSATPPAPAAGAALLSRGKRTTGWSPIRFADPRKVTDGDRATVWGAGKPTPDKPAWVAIDVGRGPARVLLTWSAAGSFNYNETDYGSPGSYRVETSADSTDGEGGTWKVAAVVAAVTTHGQAHGVAFAGQRWIKLVITSAPQVSPNGVQLDEIEVHDASSGARDAWFFMGDSITAFAFGRPPAHEIGFAEAVHGRHPARFPAVINGGVGGEKSDDGLRHVDEWLALNPDARYWCIGYGTNDAAGDAADTSRFRSNLEAVVDRLKKAGREPILATIPFASDGQHRNIPKFNEVIEEVRRTRSLPRGPDLYAWFAAHPDQLRDGLHPTDRGIGAINRLWADAAEGIYSK